MNSAEISENALADIDLSRLRSLAEEGRARPLLGGSRLVLFGGAIIIAALMQFLIQTRLLSLPLWGIAVSWFAVMAGAGIGARRTAIQSSTQQAMSLANQVERQVWRTGGLVLAMVPVAILIIGYWRVSQGMGNSGFAMFTVVPSVMFGVYAVALSASASAGALPWLQRFSWLSVIFAGLAAITAYGIWQMPVLMLGALLVSVVPGLRLMKIARGDARD